MRMLRSRTPLRGDDDLLDVPAGGGRVVKRMLEFSKLILIFETVLVGYVSHRVLGFVETAIVTGFDGSLPYLTTFITAVWAAYGASVSFYQNKSAKENVKKIEASANPDRDA